MNLWRWVMVAALTGVALIAVLIYGWLARSLPADGPQTITGFVTQPVAVFYDQRQRPFVYADSFTDAFYAQGYLHAQHRLWQMEMFRRAGSGRLAQALGAVALDTDIEIWRAGVPELAVRMQQVASPRLQRWVQAYVSGINAFLQQQSPLPPEFVLLQHQPPAWQVEDVFALAALMAYQSANNLGAELLRWQLAEELGGSRARIFGSAGTPVATPQGAVPADALRHIALTSARTNPLFSAPSLGSNAWAVAASAAASGHALIAFDSHDAVSLPNLTYDVHLFVGEAQIRGNSVAGLLGVINGFNEFMAWGFTNIGDSQDAFIETPHPDIKHRYQDGTDWYDARVDRVAIPVRDAPDHVVEVVTTRNGRLISHEPPIAVRWAPLEDHGFGLDALLALNRATTFETFQQALDQFVAPSANITYADVTGRIAQRTVGLLPQRGEGQGLVPLPGVPEHRWRGTLPMAQLPRFASPDHAYVAAANRPIASGPPLVSADNAPGYREARIHQVLGTLTAATAQDMLTLQTDRWNGQAAQLLPRMLSAVRPDTLNASQRQALERLQRWAQAPFDEADAASPLLFAVWYQLLIETLFQSELQPETYRRLLGQSYLINRAIDRHLLVRDHSDWPIDEALNTSFRQMLAQLDQRAGGWDLARWGDEHQLTLRHELGGAFPGADWLLNRGPFVAAGGNATVGRARYSHRRPYAVSGGATTRTVIEMAQPMRVWMISPGGQSDHPLSPWYNDQTRAWLDSRTDQLSSPNVVNGEPETQRPADLCIVPATTMPSTTELHPCDQNAGG